jgi:hypothetical protein
MKASNYKTLVTAAIILIGGLTTQSALAQRSGRGGSAGRGSVSRGSSHSFSRPSGGLGGNRIAGISGRNYHSVRPGIGRAGIGRGAFGRPGVIRPGYRFRPGYGYRRPYFGYRNYYRPYIGFSLSVLPFGYYPFFYGADQFYYSGGLFYRQYDDQYKVVAPPVGAEVPSLPDDAKEIVINGQTFYEYKGVYYSQVQNADGKTVYVVSGKDGVLNTDENTQGLPKVGDTVGQLPEGSREIQLKGEKYYVSPDDVYYEKIVDGNNVTYKVVSL